LTAGSSPAIVFQIAGPTVPADRIKITDLSDRTDMELVALGAPDWSRSLQANWYPPPDQVRRQASFEST
jgi:hypothetical protein